MRRFDVPQGDGAGDVAEAKRFIERHDGDPNSGLRFAGVGVGFADREKVHERAGGHRAGISDQAGGQVELQVLGQRRRRGQFAGIFERLVEIENGRQLEGVRTRLVIDAAAFGFGGERVAAFFHAERGRSLADDEGLAQRGSRHFCARLAFLFAAVNAHPILFT